MSSQSRFFQAATNFQKFTTIIHSNDPVKNYQVYETPSPPPPRSQQQQPSSTTNDLGERGEHMNISNGLFSSLMNDSYNMVGPLKYFIVNIFSN